MVASQVLNVRVVVLLEAIIGHESTVVGCDVSVSSSAIVMIVQPFGWTAACTSSCNCLWSVALFFAWECTCPCSRGSEVTRCVSALVVGDVCVSTTSV